MSDLIRGDRPGSYRTVETYPPGRRCDKCDKALSRLNPGPSCWEHTGRRRRPGRLT